MDKILEEFLVDVRTARIRIINETIKMLKECLDEECTDPIQLKAQDDARSLLAEIYANRLDKENTMHD